MLTSDDAWRKFGFRGGHVTRAFDDWRLEEGYLRAYLRLGIEFADEAYQRRWDEIAHQPSDGEGPDMFDLMDEAVGGLTPQQFGQMHLSGVLRDAVTIFEMYFEKAFAEMAAWQTNRRIDLPEHSPRWERLRRAWVVLTGYDPQSGEVDEIRKRRHWLAHQRGEFRTQEQEDRYGTEEMGLRDLSLQLTADDVRNDLEALAAPVVVADQAAYERSWGGLRVSDSDLAAALSELRWQDQISGR